MARIPIPLQGKETKKPFQEAVGLERAKPGPFHAYQKPLPLGKAPLALSLLVLRAHTQGYTRTHKGTHAPTRTQARTSVHMPVHTDARSQARTRGRADGGAQTHTDIRALTRAHAYT